MTDAISAATSTATKSTNDAARATLSQNFETFLTLLTSQLKNQDPLSPIDSNQFTQQLVQYSQVEQQIQTNDTLKTLIAQQKASTAGAALSYLGRTATIADNLTQLKDGGATWTYALSGPSTSTELRVLDSKGREVFRTTGATASGSHAFTWNGKDANGNALPEGGYRLVTKAVDGTGKAITTGIRVEEKITGVDLSGADPSVTTASGVRSFAAIVAVRE